jgi:hypothetical protein
MHSAMISRNAWRVKVATGRKLEVLTMQIEINRSTLSLAREGLVAIRDGQGTRIVCNAGSLWITQECDPKDAIITAGESFTVRNPGLTLLTALSASEVTVVEPYAEAQTQPQQHAWNREKLRHGVFA